MKKIDIDFSFLKESEYISLIYSLICLWTYSFAWDVGMKNLGFLIGTHSVIIIGLNHKDIKKLLVVAVPILAVGLVEIIYRVYDIRLSVVVCMAVGLFIVSTLIIIIKSRKELKLKYYILPAIVVVCMGGLYNSYNSHYVKNKALREIVEMKIIANGGEEGRAHAISHVEMGTTLKVGNIKKSNLKDIEKLKNLNSITIRNSIFNGKGLKKLERLEDIRLDNPSKETLNYVNGIKSAKRLTLSSISATDEYDNFRFKDMPNIERVGIADRTTKNLRVIEELGSVKEIIIYGYIQSLDGIENLKNLEVLRCYYIENIDAIFKNESIKTVMYKDDRMLEYKDVLQEHGIELVKRQ